METIITKMRYFKKNKINIEYYSFDLVLHDKRDNEINQQLPLIQFIWMIAFRKQIQIFKYPIRLNITLK